MTKDMFDAPFIKDNQGDQKTLMARHIVDIAFEDENISDTANIEGLLPKVTFVYEDNSRFILKTISSFENFAVKFIYDLIYLEIDPIAEIELESFCSLPFRFFELDTKKYLVTETVILVKDLENIEFCHTVIKGLQKQMRQGLRSAFYARMVMEMKGCSLEGKTSYVQQRIMQYIHRFPDLFDYDLIPMMNRFMTDVKELYTKNRSIKDLSKIIVRLYFCKRKILVGVKQRVGGIRQVYVKSNPLFVEELFGRKKVLGISISLSFLSENERLGEEHILKACKNFIPKIKVVENSFMNLSNKGDKEKLFYLEIEKKEGIISGYEKLKLETGLAKYLEVHIQKFARKIFMPQNTEEVMKYTVALSKELKTKNDFPQVAVLFDSQVHDSLLFTAIIVKPKAENKGKTFSIFETGMQKKYSCNIKHIRSLGDFKEGLEVSYKMRIKNFIRDDYSIDIYRARAKVIQDLEKRFGIVRDYNGGMLEKQGGLLSQCQLALRKKGIKNVVLIENFFYAMQPSEMRAIFNVDSFIEFFIAFHDLFTYQISKDTKLEVNDNKIMFFARVKSERKKDAFINEMQAFDASIGDIVYFSLRIQEKFYLGVKFKYQDDTEKSHFIDKMSICLKL